MIWTFLFLSSLGFALANLVPKPLYASYCAAILENQRSTDLHEREAISATLERFSELTKERFRAVSAPFDAKALEVLDDDSIYIHVWSSNATPLRQVSSSDLVSLKLVPERVAELRRDIYSIQEGVAAGAMEIRGQQDILAYLDRLDKSVERNENELRPAFAEANPYVTKKRIITFGSFLVVPPAILGAIGAWTVPSLLAFDLDWKQTVALIGSVPFGGGSGFMLGWPAVTYFRGVVSKKHRSDYESTFGIESSSNKYGRYGTLKRVIAASAKAPDLLIHMTDERSFSEAETFELKAAVEAKRAPSVEFATSQQHHFYTRNGEEGKRLLSFELATDVIYFFDKQANEPVLVSIDRFRRESKIRPKRRPRSNEAAGSWSLGGLKPAGI